MVALLYSIAPRDYLHAIFAHHRDTENCHTGKGIQITEKHQHCTFLETVCDQFITEDGPIVSVASLAEHKEKHYTHSTSEVRRSMLETTDRGPPKKTIAFLRQDTLLS